MAYPQVARDERRPEGSEMNGTQPAGRTARALVALATAAVLLSCPPALALNPSLDLQQYGHSSQLLGAGFVRGIIRAITQTPDGYLWLGTDLGIVSLRRCSSGRRGRRRAVSNCLAFS